MKPEDFKRIIGYFIEEAKEHLDTIYQGFFNLQNTIDDRYELEAIFRATFSLKGGAAMLGFTSMQNIVYRLEDCLKLLRYPIIADKPLQLLFLDVYNTLRKLINQIETTEGLTLEKIFDITLNIDAIFTLVNSHLLFLIDKSNYKTKITNLDFHKSWSYDIPLKLILLDSKTFLCRTFADYFAGLPNVEIINGTIEELPFFDCVVTAASSLASANSVDTSTLRFFGEDVEKLLQQRIQELYLREQPIGTSLIVETNHALHPFIAHTPTLRMQMSIAGKDHVYQAIWSTLLAIRQHNKLYDNSLQNQINIVAIPGLGTSFGSVPVDEVARQMSMAYQNFLFSLPPGQSSCQKEIQDLLAFF
jgi:O-acetyl-ADP-ribose deacetylase (regulator of RNase III)/HPt (histidine-containing phosphotransfer) domain-containing protein